MSRDSKDQKIGLSSDPHNKEVRRPIVLSIAGFDPSSGAGVTADLKVFSAHRLYGMSAITGMTVQSTQGVERCQAVDPDLLAETLECLRKDVEFDGIKVGMLASAANIKIIGDFLSIRGSRHIVLDPILRSTSGALLSGEENLLCLREKLLSKVTWVTPNLVELGILIGREIRQKAEIPEAAKLLQQQAATSQLNVLITGGHLEKPEDYLLTAEGSSFWFTGKRVETTSTHGTGCTQSSALLSQLVRGRAPFEAVRSAKNYVTTALQRAYPVGKGKGPLNHLFNLEADGGSSELFV